MRQYLEPTSANLLRHPLVLGVSMMGLLALIFIICAIQVFFGGYAWSSLLASTIAITGFVLLRFLARFGKPGWEERFIFLLEKKLAKPAIATVERIKIELSVLSPDTMDEDALIYEKELVAERLREVRERERLCLSLEILPTGAVLSEVKSTLSLEAPSFYSDYTNWYSLVRLPVFTDPEFFFRILANLKEGIVLLRFDGLNQLDVKKSIERARKNNASDSSHIRDIDSEVSFQEASIVLADISKGAEHALNLSLVIGAKEKLNLDPVMFLEEKDPLLSVLSATGARKRTHRSFRTRLVTAADFVPNFYDPKEDGIAILKSIRSLPLYFSPLDERLESLHWIVVGASGSGKSFFTGLVLKRLIDGCAPISVLFVDHNRSFRRLVNSRNGTYLEPASVTELSNASPFLLSKLEPGAMLGIELSDLPLAEKKEAARFLLSAVEAHLRGRQSSHPVYVVLDECWNFLRDEPVLVQRAFREYRKLNGAVVAITQSLSDFLSHENGQSIFQNAPVRILLRQGEDLTPLKAHLGFNDVELKLSRQLKQRKGQYSECIIKTPFLSKLGRLYPTSEEHELLRTDNIRSELIKGAKLCTAI